MKLRFHALAYLVSSLLLCGHPEAADLPAGIKNFIEDEQTRIVLGSGDPRKLMPRTNSLPTEFRPESRNIFSLKSYWVSEENFRGLQGDNFSPNLREIFTRTQNGKKEYRLLVHPLSEEFYGPLLETSQKGENFLATATASNRSLVAWLPGQEDKPFIAKVSLASTIGGVDRTLKSTEVATSIGIDNILEGTKKELPKSFSFMPESFGVYPLKADRGGMILREFTPGMLNGSEHFVPLFSLYGGKSDPLILSMIKRSGMNADVFVREKIVQPFVKQWLELTLQQGINMEPHGQNILIGIGKDGLPNGRFLHRDFGGYNIDLGFRQEAGKFLPKSLPYVHSIAADYYQAKHMEQLYTSMSIYFEGSFVWDLERHLIEWQKQGLLPKNHGKIKEGTLTKMIWKSLEKEYQKMTGIPRHFTAEQFSLETEKNGQVFASYMEEGRKKTKIPLNLNVKCPEGFSLIASP